VKDEVQELDSKKIIGACSCFILITHIQK